MQQKIGLAQVEDRLFITVFGKKTILVNKRQNLAAILAQNFDLTIRQATDLASKLLKEINDEKE